MPRPTQRSHRRRGQSRGSVSTSASRGSSSTHNRNVPTNTHSTSLLAQTRVEAAPLNSQWGFNFRFSHAPLTSQGLYADLHIRGSVRKEWKAHQLKTDKLTEYDRLASAAGGSAPIPTAGTREIQQSSLPQGMQELSLGNQSPAAESSHQGGPVNASGSLATEEEQIETLETSDGPATSSHAGMGSIASSGGLHTPPRTTVELTTDQLTQETADVISRHFFLRKREHFDMRELVILADKIRDDILSEILKSEETTGMFENIRQVLGRRDSTEWDKATRAAEFEAALVRFCNGVRAQIVKLAGSRGLGWGRDAGTGLHIYQKDRSVVGLSPQPDDEEGDEPDITVWAACPSAKHPQTAEVKRDPALGWCQLSSVWEVKLEWEKDLSDSIVGQIMRYLRRTSYSHPITGRVHAATCCGGLVRAWQFDAAGFSSTAAFDMLDPSDHLNVLRVVALMAASKPTALLQQWMPSSPPSSPSSPEPTFRVRGGPPRTPAQWQWTTPPILKYHRPSMFGSKTTVWHGRTQSFGASAMSAQTPPPSVTLVKATWLSAPLCGHEAYILRKLQGIGQTPRLLGQLPLDGSYETSHEATETRPQLFLDVFAVHHAIGEVISPSLGERHSAELSQQMFHELHLLSEVGIHYRDIHFGNWLFRWNLESGLWRVRLVLTDFGNARHGWRRRGQGNPAETPLFHPREVAFDDTRGGNPMFRPCSLKDVQDALTLMELLEDIPAKLGDAARKCITYSHRYVDDLESCIYVKIMHGIHRSGKDIKKDAALLAILESRKALIWQDPDAFSTQVDKACTGMSAEWRGMLKRLHGVILHAQSAVREKIRKHLEDKDPFLWSTVASLDAVMQEETECFEACARIFDDCIPKLAYDSSHQKPRLQ